MILSLPTYLRRSVIYHLRHSSKSLPVFTSSTAPFHSSISFRRTFSGTAFKMSDLSIELTAPNGRKYAQPTGLFINNEWVKSSNGQKLTSINPTYALLPPSPSQIDPNICLLLTVTNPKLPQSTQQQQKMSTPP